MVYREIKILYIFNEGKFDKSNFLKIINEDKDNKYYDEINWTAFCLNKSKNIIPILTNILEQGEKHDAFYKIDWSSMVENDILEELIIKYIKYININMDSFCYHVIIKNKEKNKNYKLIEIENLFNKFCELDENEKLNFYKLVYSDIDEKCNTETFRY